MKKYKVYMEGWTITTLYIDADDEHEAEEIAGIEMGFDSTDVCEVTEIKEDNDAK